MNSILHERSVISPKTEQVNSITNINHKMRMYYRLITLVAVFILKAAFLSFCYAAHLPSDTIGARMGGVLQICQTAKLGILFGWQRYGSINPVAFQFTG